MQEKLINLLKYIGIMGASICSFAYIIVVVVLIQGFKAEKTAQTIIFAVVNAIVGFIIMQFLKVQGEQFAKNKAENKPIIEEYYNSKTTDKKLHSMKYYWITSVFKDILTKVVTVFISTVGIVYIVVVGSNDWNLLMLALVNLLLFICFGLLALNNAYEFFNNRHIPYMLAKINEIKTKTAPISVVGDTSSVIANTPQENTK